MAPHRPYMAFPKTNTRYMFKPPTDTNIYSPRNTVPCSLIALRSLLSISYLLSLSLSYSLQGQQELIQSSYELIRWHQMVQKERSDNNTLVLTFHFTLLPLENYFYTNWILLLWIWSLQCTSYKGKRSISFYEATSKRRSVLHWNRQRCTLSLLQHIPAVLKITSIYRPPNSCCP